MTINKELSEDEQDNKTQYEYFGFQKKRRELEGGLYLVSTPIGNLEDITLRALRVLQEVDFIAAEDTRTARKLLHAYEISNQIISFYRDNEAKKIPQIIESLKAGKRIALISEAGTPAISDPGFRLIREARKEELNIIPIPGASAAIPALISSGIPCDHFLFLGFLPNRKGKRQQTLNPYIDLPITLIFYMSPHNAIGLLRDLQEFLGDRQAFIARELTKKYEEHLSGSLSQLSEILQQREKLKGEFVLIVEGMKEKDPTLSNQPLVSEEEKITNAIRELIKGGGKPAKLARKLTSLFPSLSRQKAYQYISNFNDN